MATAVAPGPRFHRWQHGSRPHPGPRPTPTTATVPPTAPAPTASAPTSPASPSASPSAPASAPSSAPATGGGSTAAPLGAANYAGSLVLNATGSQLASWNKTQSYCPAQPPGFVGDGKVSTDSSGNLTMTTTGAPSSCVGLISPNAVSSGVIEADIDFPAARLFQTKLPKSTTNLTPGWHTVDIAYKKGFFAVYYDGKQYTSFSNDNITGSAHNIFLSMAVTPDTGAIQQIIGGSPVNSDSSPATLSVKYVRIWSFK